MSAVGVANPPSGRPGPTALTPRLAPPDEHLAFQLNGLEVSAMPSVASDSLGTGYLLIGGSLLLVGAWRRRVPAIRKDRAPGER
jgi:hypothetical protein